MSFSSLPLALYPLIARFFIFEHSVDPARAEQLMDGHRLLAINREMWSIRRVLKRAMVRVSCTRDGVYKVERSANRDVHVTWLKHVGSRAATLDGKPFPGATLHATGSVYPRNEVMYNSDTDEFTTEPTIMWWDEHSDAWVARPHPILLAWFPGANVVPDFDFGRC